MQNIIKELIQEALQQLHLELPKTHAIQVERTKDPAHGDFASNIALLLAKTAGMPPRQLAEKICEKLAPNTALAKTEIAGPGFINFFLGANAALSVVAEILEKKEQFGHNKKGEGKRVLVEFVSANPTGPLHVGHGRGAAIGSCIANLLAAIGFNVEREYYVNDAGRQMDILATSIWLRYLQACNVKCTFPNNGYHGDYLLPIATNLKKTYAEQFTASADQVYADVPLDGSNEDTKEAKAARETHIDALISNAKKILGQNYKIVFDLGLQTILNDIHEDLTEFGVIYESWFSERTLEKKQEIAQAIDALQAKGHLYEKEGAIWFRSTAFGDDKDRVVKRENGQTTYFAADVAYHFDKMQRGYDMLINVFGADHHGYVPRIRAALQALGFNTDGFFVTLVQFAILYRNGQRVQMSTRSGSFVTLRELREEVGNDATRFFYIMRKADQHLDFDLDLAKAQSQDNPLYYIQYAYARVCSVFKQLQQKGFTFDKELGLKHLGLLTTSHEIALLRRLPQYIEVLEQAALEHEPHRIAQYLRDLATDLHSYYNAQIFIVNEPELRNARLALVQATGQVLGNGLHLLGLTAPEHM